MNSKLRVCLVLTSLMCLWQTGFAQHFKHEGTYSDGLVVVKKYDPVVLSYVNQYCYANEYDKLVIPMKYGYAEKFRDGVAIVGMGIKYGLINKAGKEILPIKCDYISVVYQGLVSPGLGSADNHCDAYIIVENKRLGCLDKYGKLIVPCEYRSCTALAFNDDESCNTIAIGLMKDDRWYLFDPVNGSLLLPKGGALDYDEYKSKMNIRVMDYVNMGRNNYIRSTRTLDNLIIYDMEGKKGVYDYSQKKTVIPPLYESISQKYNVFVIGDGKSYGVMDNTGNMIIPMEYDKVFVRSANYKCSSIEVHKGEEYGIFDGEGNVMAPLGSKVEGREGTGGYGLISFGGKYGVIKEGEMVIDMVFDSIDLRYEGAILRLDGKYGLVSSKMFKKGSPIGKEAIVYDNVIRTKGELYICKKDGLCGLKGIVGNGEMREVYPVDYEDIEYDNVYHCYLVKQSGKWGFFDGYNTKGKVFYDTKPERLKKEDCYSVQYNGKKGVVTKEDIIIVPFEYDDVDYLGYGSNTNTYTYALKQNGKWGIGEFKDGKPRSVSDFAFDEIRGGHDAICPVRVDEKWGYVYWGYDNGLKIAMTIKPKYDEVGDFYEGKALVKQGKKEFYIDIKGKKVK